MGAWMASMGIWVLDDLGLMSWGARGAHGLQRHVVGPRRSLQGSCTRWVLIGHPLGWWKGS